MKPFRIIAIALVLSLSVAGMSIAAGDNSTDTPRQATVAAVELPAEMPTADREMRGAYGYVSSQKLAAQLGGNDAAPAANAPGVVVVTATILPVRTIEVDRSGNIVSIISNHPDPAHDATLFVVRGADGEKQRLTQQIWDDVRSALQSPVDVTGTIYQAS